MSKKHKIAILTSHVIQYQGPLFKKLAEQPDIDLTVLFCSRKGVEQYHDEEFGVAVKWDRDLLSGYRYQVLRNYSPCRNTPLFFQCMNFGIIHKVRKKKYDAVIILGYGWFMAWLTSVTARLMKVPIILRGDSNSRQLYKSGSFTGVLKKFILRAHFLQYDTFLSSGRSNREYYEFYGVKDDVIFDCPLAVDNDFFFKEHDKYRREVGSIKSVFDITPHKKVILFSGKFLKRKRPLDLLMAFAKMKFKDECVLVYAGDGPLRAQVIEYAKNNGITESYFLGFLNQSEIGKAYAMADIFVFPSDYEPFGLALNEAMCFGLPVIVSSEVGASDDLVNGNGFVYPSGDINMLAQLMDKLVEDEALRKCMGKRSLEIILEWNYSKDVKGILKALQYVDRRRH